MFKFLKDLFGTKHERDVQSYMPKVEQINEYFQEYQSLSNDELRQKTNEFKGRIAEYLSDIDNELEKLQAQAVEEKDFGVKEELFNELDQMEEDRNTYLEEILMELLPEAFAVVKETANRFKNNKELIVTATDFDRDLAASHDFVEIKGEQAVWKNEWLAAGAEIQWDMVHYDVQLIGGMVLHDGKIAEMATGEGKTLVATLPGYLNGLSGRGVHIVTVNDYLAKRDSEWVGPIYQFLFLTVDCIDKHRPHSPQRHQAYMKDIAFGTNNEFGFDYLRDNMVRSQEEQVQRKHHYTIVDEVDSVLIDDARTPLIISGPIPKDADQQEYVELKPIVERVVNEQKKLATEYLADAKKLIQAGKLGHEEDEGGMALLRSYRAYPKYRPLIKFLSEDGIKSILQKTENHYMQEQSKHMHIVDEPLYFTIDEKNRGVEITEKGVEYLSRYQDDPQFFVMPDLATSLNEIDQQDISEKEKKDQKQSLILEYSEKSKRLHSVSQLLKAYALFEKDEEYVVMDGQVKIVDEQTGRMMEGRRYSDGLHQALEAKENVKVGELTQTYATVTLQNYFRMYHKLSGMTGTAETEASELWEIYELDVSVVPTNKPIIRDDRDDYLFRTQREKYAAVIEEVKELTEAGRPVLVGTTSVDTSEKLSRMLNIANVSHNVLNAKHHQREAEIVAEAGKPGRVTIATNMAGRGTDIKIRQEVKDAGGLAIIGTERHDSRRVDRQLRGRAGRQGDPGSSQFFVSLEDNLMRLFMNERAIKIMDRMGLKDGEVIQNRMMTKSIEGAQKKVEENNFGIRKRLLEYDDVMNIQREAIYKKRENALTGERLIVDLRNMVEGFVDSLVYEHKSAGDYNSFREASLREIGYDPEIKEEDFETGSVDKLSDQFREDVWKFYEEKENYIKRIMLPIIKNVYENEGNKYKRITLPYSDGSSKVLNLTADLKKAVETEGYSIMRDLEKTVTLALIDENWKEHLRYMDELKESVQAASFEQKDPLVIYKMEAYNLFEELIYKINREVSGWILGGKIMIEEPRDVREARTERTDLSKMKTSRSEEEQAARRAAENAGGERQKVETFVRTEKKVGRNDPCPCGSGKKFKQCHGRV
ncbi:preprotein translocase subunit SecA [Membranicola marinus]|uniref:Protein translocase subunit SecA n=1 Tax=Membranihabitans marinus TaxID=1227546 RepID=A0A953HUJ2_9BACT|nr:preprotein translocase subunit SecA [Membranihabitans marinus]MBY5958128.1 preprotein translocase subunit SecA [Membranihabitans marinus]